MMPSLTRAFILAGGVALALGLPSTQPRTDLNALQPAPGTERARRIILLIGDGMGDSEITLARYYALGAAGRLAMDALPFTGAYTTYSVEERDPAVPTYVPDSAATGTAWATGHKTSNGRISTSAGTDRDMTTILELAQSLRWRTGNVTTAELTDATPAVLAAHVSSRSCQGPADMSRCPQDRKSAGGPGSIAEQMIDHGIDVMLGGGAARFEQRPPDGGDSALDTASRRGYRVARTTAELNAVASTPVLGIFAPGNMSLEWKGQEALPYPANARLPQRCEEGQRPPIEPSLAEMTAKAIALLGGPSGTQSFFLQVEGASIDKQDHAANPCGQIGETIALDRAVKVGLDYAQTHPDTLLIVTADHGHTSQIVGIPSDGDYPPGLLSILITADCVPMAVSYGTNGYHRSQDHTGTQVRIAAIGPQAGGVLGLIDQTDLFRIMARAMGVNEGRATAGQ